MNSTRRNFFRSTGLVLGAAIVAPAVLADEVTKLDKPSNALCRNPRGRARVKRRTAMKVYPGDILCKGCRHKLYDAERNLKYDFMVFGLDEYKYGSAYKCVYCGNLMSTMEHWETFKGGYPFGQGRRRSIQ